MDGLGDASFPSSLAELPFVPARGFPLVFHGVRCRHTKTRTTTSLLNQEEVDVVLHYAARLAEAGARQDAVGFISPYRRQVRAIREKLQVRIN